MANTIANLIQPIGNTLLMSVGTGSTSSSLTVTTPDAIVGGVLISNLTANNTTYVSISSSVGSVTAPTTSVSQFVVPVLGGTQVTVNATPNPQASTVWVNAIAVGSGSIAITPLA